MEHTEISTLIESAKSDLRAEITMLQCEISVLRTDVSTLESQVAELEQQNQTAQEGKGG